MIKKYEGFLLNFLKKEKEDTSDIVQVINDVVNNLNDLNNVDVKAAKEHIIKGNDSEKIKIVFAVSLNKGSILDFLNELENINSHLGSENFIANLYFLNDKDMDGPSGHIINKNNYSDINSDIFTDPNKEEQVPGLYLVVKRIDNKSNYIF